MKVILSQGMFTSAQRLGINGIFTTLTWQTPLVTGACSTPYGINGIFTRLGDNYLFCIDLQTVMRASLPPLIELRDFIPKELLYNNRTYKKSNT